MRSLQSEEGLSVSVLISAPERVRLLISIREIFIRSFREVADFFVALTHNKVRLLYRNKGNVVTCTKQIIAFSKQVEGKLNRLHCRTVWDPQAVGTTFLGNVGNCLPIDIS